MVTHIISSLHDIQRIQIIMKYWLHRISHKGHLSYPLLENDNTITIGWSDFSNQQMLDIITRKDSASFSNLIQSEWGHCPRSRWSLWSFVGDMSIGDIVLIPRPWEFRVYRITSCAEFCISDLLAHDLGWQRKVEPITKWLSRSKYADAPLTSRMKYRGTTTEITDLRESIERAIANKPLSIYSDMVESTLPAWSSLMRQYNNPDKFERLIAWYFKRAGANEISIPAKNTADKVGDCDVEAVFEPIRTIVSVQVKRHDGSTDAYSVNQISEYSDDADTGGDDVDYIRARWVVSTANTFTVEAKLKAKEHNVLLLNCEDFVMLLLSMGIDEGIDV